MFEQWLHVLVKWSANIKGQAQWFPRVCGLRVDDQARGEGGVRKTRMENAEEEEKALQTCESCGKTEEA